MKKIFLTVLMILLLMIFNRCSSSGALIPTIYPTNEVSTASTGENIMQCKTVSYMDYEGIVGRVTGEVLWKLIYTGLEANYVKFLYYEFFSFNKQNLIKSDFTVEYKYDISENRTIYFKDIEIEVINATSSAIKYNCIPSPCYNKRLLLLEVKSTTPFYAGGSSAMVLNAEETKDLDSLKSLCEEFQIE
ncbi:hypothetical protein ACFLSS_03030 [Bacteroidota bacterium]